MEEFGNIIDLGKRRLEKLNGGKRDAIAVTPEGDIRYPDQIVKITEAEAFDVAREVVGKFSDKKMLLGDSKSHHAEFDVYGQKDPHAPQLQELMEQSLESQRAFAVANTTEGLVRILEMHKNNPAHYNDTMILATSEELIRRFTPKAL
ncbi:MAG TPA: hypothetical protein VMU13_03885 [Candidatus Paceibacterota bacterium]|nr:hypothetical protein [Candidatus Paceibacterota bacterium]